MRVIEVDRLEVLVEAEAKKANAELDKLIGKLNNVSSALNGVNTNGLRNMANGITNLSKSMQSMSNVKNTDFNRLSRNIQKLGNINQARLYQTSNGLRNITNTLNSVGSVSDDAVKLGEVSKNISKLGNASIQKTISTLPQLSVALRDFMTTLSTSPQVSQNLINMTNAMANLAQQGSKYNSTIKSMSNATNTLEKTQGKAKRTTSSLSAETAKLIAVYYAVMRAVRGVGNSIEKSMDFGETLNLFQTTFKKIGMETASELGMTWGSESADAYAKGFINRAQGFNTMLTDALSLDPNIMMNYQAIFAQMTNSMGLVADSSMKISESFTMLGTDIASLWNIDIDTAMYKLQSGLAGQIRPLRQLGVDISQTSLELTALKYGIKDSVKDMSQAAKVQLRWLSIMDQTEVAFGDMAKTIDSPANQLRILQQGWTNLSRSIGNIFLPIVTTVLPYINGLVIALRRLVDTLATAVGFELPDYSDSNIYTESPVVGDLAESYDGLADSADNATKANEKLKDSVLSLDEFNPISKDSSDSGSSTSGGAGSGYSELDDAISQKSESYMSKFNEEMAKMSNQAKEIADVIQPKLEKFVEFMGEIAPILEGIAAAFITYKVITWFGNLATAIGALSMTPAGVIALAVGGLVMIYEAVKKYNEKLMQEDLASRFGDITLSLEEVKEIAEEITNSEYSAKLDVYISEKAKLDDIEKDIQGDIDALNKLNWKVSVGLKLTEAEQAEYKSSIDSYIKDCNDYITQQQYVVSLAIDATITQNDDFASEMQTLANNYYNKSKTELDGLGKKLRNTMDKALADGVLDADESKLIVNLQKEMSDVLERTADAEFTAKLQMITVDGDLTADSFKDVTKEVQKIAQERIDKATEAEFTTRATIVANYNLNMKNATTPAEKAKLTKDYEADLKTVTDEFSKTKATITLDGLDFSLGTLSEKFAPEIDKILPIVSQSIKDTVDEGLYVGFQNIAQDKDGRLKDAYSQPLERLTTDMANYWDMELDKNLSTTTRNSAADMFAELEPTKEELEKIYSDSLNAGKKVPDGVSAGLTDIAKMGAIAGNMDSINFLLGQKLSTDATFIDTLKKSKTAGTDLDDSLIAGLKSKIPDLQLQGEKLVSKTWKAVDNATTDPQVVDMVGSATKMINSFDGTFKNNKTTKTSVESWLGEVSSTVSSWKFPPLFIDMKINAPTMPDIPGYSVNESKGPVKKYATGGIPGFGEMFIAREAGPELVGRIGSRTAVVNNDQIVQAVSQGVASAIASALPRQSQSQSQQPIILELDGEVIYNNQQKVARNRGYNFGMGVFAR